MNKEMAKRYTDYHIWANRQVWDCVERLSDEQFFQDDTYSHGSVYNQMYHLMESDWFTPYAVRGGFPQKDDPTAFNQEMYSDRASLRAKWDELEAALLAFVEGVDDAGWLRPFEIPKGEGKMARTCAWEMLVAGCNHGTNHRAQVLRMLAEFGVETVEQGFFFFVMQSE
ncbi:MAG TPA: DinB family protein [Anaerolineae bacterium]|nr:DinB family protein [Anaerolineae bacterium]